jgi:uncharacterized protein YndB with AHSA1/START domain
MDMTNLPLLTEITGTGKVRRLQTQISISKDVAEVWNAITETKHIGHWWTHGTVGKRAGEAFQLADREEVKGTIICMRAPHVFEFTWHELFERLKDYLERALHLSPLPRSTGQTRRIDEGKDPVDAHHQQQIKVMFHLPAKHHAKNKYGDTPLPFPA